MDDVVYSDLLLRHRRLSHLVQGVETSHADFEEEWIPILRKKIELHLVYLEREMAGLQPFQEDAEPSYFEVVAVIHDQFDYLFSNFDLDIVAGGQEKTADIAFVCNKMHQFLDYERVNILPLFKGKNIPIYLDAIVDLGRQPEQFITH